MTPQDELLVLLNMLVAPEQRRSAITRLAEHLGAAEVLILIQDDEVQALLPAPGFPPTLNWNQGGQRFLDEVCARGHAATCVDWGAPATARTAQGWCASDGSVLLLIGIQAPDRLRITAVVELLPLVCAALRAEHTAASAHHAAAYTGQLAGRMQELAQRLEAANAEAVIARRELEHQLVAAQEFAALLDLEALVQAVTDHGTRLSGAAFGAFFYSVLDGQGGRYMLYTVSGAPREAFSRFPMPRATELFGPTLRGEGVIRSDDIVHDPRYGQAAPLHGMPPGHLPVRSYLAVPVVSRTSEVIGGLFFGHPQPARFTTRHERLLLGVAAQAAVAIDNARLYEAERAARARESERARLAVLNGDIGIALVQQTTLHDRLRTCCELLVRHLDVAFARIWTFNEREAMLELQASAGLYTHIDGDHSRIPLGAFKIGEIAKERRPHVTNAVIGDPRVPEQEWARREGLISFAGYPLAVDDQLVGVIGMFSRHELSQATIGTLESIGHGISIAVDRARAEEELGLKARELERSNRELQQFASVASHDLKEPLRTIGSYLSILECSYGESLDPEGLKYIKRAIDGSARMGNLINALLSYAQSGAGENALVPVDLNSILSEAIDTLGQRIADTGADVSYKDLPQVRGDAILLSQLFQNLISNGIKFQKKGAKPRVAISAERRGAWWQVAVKDNGIGIPHVGLQRIFEVFNRFHGREFEGSGIGLATCRRIVEQHGGSIHVDSEVDHGTTFTVSLPVDADAVDRSHVMG